MSIIADLAKFGGSLFTPASIKAGGGVLWNDSRTRYYPSSCRNGVAYGFTSGTSRYAQSIRQQRRNGRVPLRRIRIRLANWALNASGGGTGAQEIANTNRIKVNISIAFNTTSAVPTPFYQNGSRDIIVEPGANVEVVDTSGLIIPANTTYYVFIYATAIDSAGNQMTTGKLPMFRATTQFGGGVEKVAFDAAATDKTMTVGGETTAIGSPADLFSPFAILGSPIYSLTAASPAVIGFGDSIMHGRVEVDNYGSDSVGNSGFAERWLGRSDNLIGFINCGVSSTRAASWASNFNSNSYNRLLEALDNVGTHALVATGVNDAATDSASTIIASNNTIATFLRDAMGIKSVTTTLTPIAATTDLWATDGNQTDVSPNTTNRNAYNPLIRAGSYGSAFVGYIDVAATIENAQLRWQTTGSANGYCGDTAGIAGVHPNAAGHAKIAAALPQADTVFKF